MTKEELKQEAEEKCVCTDEAMRIMDGIGYIDGAEPREKRIAELEQEIERLKLNEQLAINNGVLLLKENAELKEELKEWKDEWQEQVQKAIDEGYARTQQTIQLTKAKELIEDMYDKIPASHSDYYKDVMDRARHFLEE